MRYTEGSILQYTPQTDTWLVEFKTDDQTWEVPVIGWAVVVVFTDWDEHGNELDEMQTHIEPVLLDEIDATPALLREYLDNRTKGIKHTLRRI